MDKFLDTCKAISFCLFFIFGAIFFHKATNSIPDLKPTLTKANTALDTINRPTTGTLAEITKTTLALKSTLVHIDMAVDHEDKNLTSLDAQERTLFSDAHTTLFQGQQTMLSAQESLQNASSMFATTETTILGVRPVLSHLDTAVTDVDISVKGFNTLFASPETTATLKNVSDITFHADHMMDIGDQVETKATHTYLHPSTNPWARGWNATSPWLLPALKIAASVAP